MAADQMTGMAEILISDGKICSYVICAAKDLRRAVKELRKMYGLLVLRTRIIPRN